VCALEQRQPGTWTVPQQASRRSDQVPGPQQLRQQEKHEEKLESIREQVAQGKLVIRKMTAAERKRYPPREPGQTQSRSKRSR
jgi:hypothetical protein